MIEYIDFAGKKIKYARFGKDPRVFLMLPGIFLNSVVDDWQLVKKAYEFFLDEYTFYLFDYQFIDHAYSIKDFANCFYHVLKKLGLNDLYVFGVSMGGAIAQELTIAHSEMVKKLFLASTLACSNELFDKVAENWLSLARAYRIYELNDVFFKCCFTDSALKSLEPNLSSLCKKGSIWDCDRFVLGIESLLKHDCRALLGNIKRPTMVVGPSDDKVLGKEASPYLSSLIPNSILYMYEGYNHAVYDEAPDYKKRIYDFFGG